ncbi:ABC transporter permease [Novosphingobium panipatense]
MGEAVTEVLRDLAVEKLDVLGQAVRTGPPVTIVREPMFNPTAGYKGYVFPAVTIVIIQQTLLFGVATFVGGRRRDGRWRMGHGEYLGTWAAFTSVGLLTCLFLFGFIFWVQGISHDENVAGMLLAAPLLAASVAGLGLWLGSYFDRSERAMMILAPTSAPFFFLSGTAWPLDQMPGFVRAVAQLIPSTSGVQVFVPLNQMHASLADVAPGCSRSSALRSSMGARLVADHRAASEAEAELAGDEVRTRIACLGRRRPSGEMLVAAGQRQPRGE